MRAHFQYSDGAQPDLSYHHACAKYVWWFISAILPNKSSHLHTNKRGGSIQHQRLHRVNGEKVDTNGFSFPELHGLDWTGRRVPFARKLSIPGLANRPFSRRLIYNIEELNRGLVLSVDR